MREVVLYPVVSFITGTTPNGGGLWKYVLRGSHGLLRRNLSVMTQVLHFLDFSISPAALQRWRAKPLRAHYNGLLGLDYTGDIFADSGGFTLLTDPDLDLTDYAMPSSQLAEHITQLQLDLGSNYLVSLDYPIPPNLSPEDAQKRQYQTLQNALRTARYLRDHNHSGVKLYVPVHGRSSHDVQQFTLKLLEAFEHEGLANQIYGIALGSMVPLRKLSMESSILDFCRAVRAVIPASMPLHVFGITGSLMPFLVASGANSFDASGYVQNARVLRYLHPDTRQLISYRKLQGYPCECEVCRERDYQVDIDTLNGENTGLQKSEVYATIALHNLGVEYRLVDEINKALTTGQLEKLLEELPRRYPSLRWPKESFKKTFSFIRTHTPEDFDLRKINWQPDPKPIALFLPCSQEKPYTVSFTYQTVAHALYKSIPEWHEKIQIIFLSGLYGPVPIEMVNHPNVIDYDFKLHPKDRIGIARGIERVSEFLRRYSQVFRVIAGYVTQPAYRHILEQTKIVLLPKESRKKQNDPVSLRQLVDWLNTHLEKTHYE